MSLKLTSRHLLYRHTMTALAIGLASGASAGGNPEYSEITSLIGDAVCQEDSQCKTIAVGHNACGGPAAFLAWSSMRTDEKELRRAVATSDARHKRIAGPGLDHSTCRVLTDPGAECVKPAGATVGTCRLKRQPDGLSDR